MNKVILTGNLCKDNEVKSTTSGKKVLTNTLAVRRDVKNAEGNYDTDFISLVVWEKQAEFLENYTGKGDKIAVVGRWNHRSYQSNDGKTRYVDECVVESVEIIAHKEEKEEKPTNSKPKVESDNPFVDEDLPF